MSRGLLSLSSLAVDTDTRRVFWADSGRHHVESADYDGSSRRSVVADRLQVPVSVAVLGRHVYWVDDAAQTVERADKDAGSDRVVVKRRLMQLTDVVAVVRATPADGRCVNACGRLHCSHVCVVEADGAARCSCPVAMSLGADALTCARDVGDCGAEQVRCGDGGACVPRCDGVTDCPDGVDEAGCYGSCLSSQFQCLSGSTRCVSSTLRCDGRADCDDASDEVRCARCVRPGGALLCRADGRCVGRESVCDGRWDCSNGEDERHCSPVEAPGPRHAAGVVVGSVFALLLVVLAALSGVFWRRRRLARRHKTLDCPDCPTLPAIPSKPALQAVIGGSAPYDRVPVGSTSTSSSGRTSVSSVPLHHYYPRETLNPPPSLCTSAYSYWSRRAPYVVTPCSTDVCDDLDSATALAYETEPLYRPPPPPPTPNSRCADDDRASSLGWYETTTSATRWCYDDCERHQHCASSVRS